MDILVPESEWLPALSTLAPWPMPKGPVVLVAPHPDDETLAAGGLLAALAEAGRTVTVIAVTNGERAYSEDPDRELAKIRRQEQCSALRKLGIPETRLLRLGLPDSDVTRYEGELIERILSVLRALGPTAEVIAPAPTDFHPDHEASGRAAQAAVAVTGNPLHLWFWWSWHRKAIADVTGYPVRRFELEPRWLATKEAALAEYTSQVGPGAILPDELLVPARRDFEVFA